MRTKTINNDQLNIKINKGLKKIAKILNIIVFAEQKEKINLNRLINKWTCGSKVYNYVHIDEYRWIFKMTNRKEQLLKLIHSKCCNLTTQQLKKVRDYIKIEVDNNDNN